jgi:hypothetical protein
VLLGTGLDCIWHDRSGDFSVLPAIEPGSAVTALAEALPSAEVPIDNLVSAALDFVGFAWVSAVEPLAGLLDRGWQIKHLDLPFSTASSNQIEYARIAESGQQNISYRI